MGVEDRWWFWARRLGGTGTRSGGGSWPDHGCARRIEAASMGRGRLGEGVEAGDGHAMNLGPTELERVDNMVLRTAQDHGTRGLTMPPAKTGQLFRLFPLTAEKDHSLVLSMTAASPSLHIAVGKPQ